MNNQPGGRGPGDQTPYDVDDRAGTGAGTNQRPTTGGLEDAVHELQQFADEQTEEAKAAIGNATEDKKNLAARQLDGVASALEKVGAELERSDQQLVGGYARQIGTSLQRFARDMEGRDLGEIAGMAEDFGRRQPLAFLGMAAIAGLAASRFVTASADRRSSRTGSQASPPASPAGVAAGESRPQPKEDRHNG